MTTQHPTDQLIPLELTRDDIVWLRGARCHCRA